MLYCIWNTPNVSPFHLTCSLTLSSEFTLSKTPPFACKSDSYKLLHLFKFFPQVKVNFTFAKFSSNASPQRRLPNILIGIFPQKVFLPFPGRLYLYYCYLHALRGGNLMLGVDAGVRQLRLELPAACYL